MRTAITLVKRGGKWSTLFLPDTDAGEQKEQFKKLTRSGKDVEFEAIEIWDSSGGRVKRYSFEKQRVREESAKKAAKAEAEAKAQEHAREPQPPSDSEPKEKPAKSAKQKAAKPSKTE